MKVDDSTTYVTANHIIRSDFFGNKGKDMCLKFFGKERKECREWNKTH